MPEAAELAAATAMAIRLRQEGRWRQMVEFLQPLSCRKNADPRIAALLAEAWLLGGRDAQAATALATAPVQGPANAFVEAAVARLKLRQGDHSGAEAAASRALRLAPTDPDYRLLAAALTSVRGSPLAALSQVEEILAENPDHAASHARRAMLLSSLGRRPEALASARTADAKGFRHPDAWRLYLSVGDRGLAIDALEYRLSIDPADAPAMVSLGELLRGAGKTAEGLAWLEKAVEAAPSDARAWAGYGTALQASLRKREAGEAYRQALILAPGEQSVTLNLAAIDFEAARYESVLETLEPLVAAGRATAAIHIAAGKAAAALGDVPRAASAYEAALALDPESFEALDALGRTGEASALYQIRGDASVLTLDDLSEWLQLLVSEPSLGDPLTQFERFADAVRPNSRERARLATYPLVSQWIRGDMDGVARLLGHRDALAVEEMADEHPRRFFLYVERLAAFRAARPELYADFAALEEVAVIGESHCLSPAHLIGLWQGRRVRFRPRFIMGAKMFTLASLGSPAYAVRLAQHLRTVPEKADLLFTIGEIDCRPDEGIWLAHRRTGRAIAQLAEETVTAYLGRLDQLLAGRASRSVTIQGVPAPAYEVAPQLKDDERVQDFLKTIVEVNARLEAGARARGWAYLDTWTATAAADGTSNRLWHIDGYHLSPGFYTETADLMRRS